MNSPIIRFPLERTTRNPKRRTPGEVVPFRSEVQELMLSISQAAPGAPKSIY